MQLVARLHEEIARGPIAAALAVRDAVAADAAAAAAIADNGELDMPIRVAALLAIAVVAQDGVSVPDAAVVALEDDLLVDAVIERDASSAITGIVDAAGERVSERVRRYLALRLKAAGATGMHVASLLVAAEDLDGAVRAALPSLDAALLERADDETIVRALAAVVADWARARPAFGDLLAVALPTELRTLLGRAVQEVAPDVERLVDALR